jgi:hypothetical protein
MSLLILTVGTGTTGRYSNLAQGLINTLALQNPAAYRLIPSRSPDSIAIADLVREGSPCTFLPWGETELYLPIANHDSIADCRATVRRVIRATRAAAPDAEILVNPTSGTKQMSAGATLAALDENIASISFTVGKRSDGVVMTGAEEIETFDPSTIFFERDMTLAIQLAASGAFSAAAQLLAPHTSGHPAAADARDTCLCLYEWERLNYEAARQIAARSSAPALVPVRAWLQTLAQTVGEARPPSPSVIADLLCTADIFRGRGDHESSLFYTCKALEMGLRLAFARNTGLKTSPYPLEEVCKLPISDETRAFLRYNSRDGRTVILGLHKVADILSALGEPIAETFLADKKLRDLVDLRNKMTHAIQSVSPTESGTMIERTRALFATLNLPTPAPRPGLSL